MTIVRKKCCVDGCGIICNDFGGDVRIDTISGSHRLARVRLFACPRHIESVILKNKNKITINLTDNDDCFIIENTIHGDNNAQIFNNGRK